MDTHVGYLLADKWDGVYYTEEKVILPTILDINRVVEALDAQIRTQVLLFSSADAYLSIAGGAGQYVSYAATSDGLLWNLLSSNDDDKSTILLTTGGQKGDFAARQVVDKGRALQAARTYYLTGQLDPQLRWEEQA